MEVETDTGNTRVMATNWFLDSHLAQLVKLETDYSLSPEIQLSQLKQLTFLNVSNKDAFQHIPAELEHLAIHVGEAGSDVNIHVLMNYIDKFSSTLGQLFINVDWQQLTLGD